MKQFNDNTGRPWLIDINVDTVKRVRDLTGIDLLKFLEGSLIQDLMSDPVVLVNAIYAACKPAADQAKISDEDFGRAMSGDAIDAATTALIEGIVDFFPKARRDLMRRAVAKIQSAETMALGIAGSRIDAIDLDKLMQLGDSSGNSPESSASPRFPSRSDS